MAEADTTRASLTVTVQEHTPKTELATVPDTGASPTAILRRAWRRPRNGPAAPFDARTPYGPA